MNAVNEQQLAMILRSRIIATKNVVLDILNVLDILELLELENEEPPPFP